MPKSSKRFVLHTDRVNSQGFRMLTDGADLSDFLKNPIMLFNHIRPEGNQKTQILPIGYWTDIEVKDGQITGVPFFDDKDEFAMSIYHKVENGIIKMASVGAEPIETSNKKDLLLPGQTLETVTRWKMKEASICDIGSNPDALAVALYDSSSQLIQLTESVIPIIQSTNNNMAKKPTKAAIAAAKSKLLKMADDAETEVAAVVGDNAAKAIRAKYVALSEELEKKMADDDPEKALAEEPEGDEKDKEITSLKAKLAELEQKLQELEEKLKLASSEPEEEDAEIKAVKLADAALSMKKITLAEKPHIIKLATADYDATLQMLKARKAHISVKEALEHAKSGDEIKLAELSKKSYDELFKSGELEYLKLHDVNTFRAKFKEKFGKEPKNI